MKYIKILFITIYIIVSFIACNSTSNNNSTSNKESAEKFITFNFPDKLDKEYCPLSKIADTILFIPLETTPESFLGNITSVDFNDSTILVNDRKRLLTFTWEGKFIRKIGSKGKGPGEYLRILNFVLNRDTVFISSTGKFGLEKFTLDGKYLGFIPLKSQLWFFTRYNDDGYVWYNRKFGQVCLFNKQWEITDTLTVEKNVSKERLKYSVGSIDQQYFNHSPNGVLFKNYINDTVWSISAKGKQAVMRFDLKNKLLPKELQVEYTKHQFYEKAKPYERVNIVMSTDSIILLTKRKWALGVGQSNPTSFYIYDKVTGKTKGYESTKIYDDMFSHSNHSILYYLSDKYLLSLINYNDIVNGRKEATSTEEKAFWEHLSKNQTMNSNPILVVIKLK